MNLKEIGKKINEYFNSENIDLEVTTKDTEVETKEEETQKFVDATLQDGTVVQIEPALEVGAAVVVVLEDEVVPAPDGSHILEDNTEIIVEGGLITEIVTPDMEEEPVEEMEKEPTATETEREAKKVIESIITEKQFNELKEKFEDLETKYEFLKTENETLTAMFNDKFNELGGLFKELFAEPTQEPIKKTRNVLKPKSDNMFTKFKKK